MRLPSFPPRRLLPALLVPLTLAAATPSHAAGSGKAASAHPASALVVEAVNRDGEALAPQVQATVALLPPWLQHARSVTCTGHLDRTGASPTADRALALARATQVCDALGGLGVQATRRVASAGHAAPRATNRTAAGRARNRRVEITIGG